LLLVVERRLLAIHCADDVAAELVECLWLHPSVTDALGLRVLADISERDEQDVTWRCGTAPARTSPYHDGGGFTRACAGNHYFGITSSLTMAVPCCMSKLYLRRG
jgi:hypothetical protein